MTDNPTANDIALLREALKPCPCCESPDIIPPPKHWPEGCVYCRKCGLRANSPEAWNTRPIAPGQHDGTGGLDYAEAARVMFEACRDRFMRAEQCYPAIDALSAAGFLRDPKPSTEQARAEGYVVVPREPSRAMLDAVDMQVVGCCNMDEADARECWTAMLDAAATPPGADALGDRL
jgi:hypothetical protein